MRSQVIQSMVVNLLIVGVGLLNSMLLARLLGPTGRGEVAAAMLWPTLLIYLGSMGLFSATIYFVALPEAPSAVPITVAVLVGLLATITFVVGYFAMPFLLRGQSELVQHSARVFLCSVPFSMIATVGTGALMGHMQTTWVNALRSISPVGYLAGSLLLAATGRLSVANIVWLQVGLSLFFFVATILRCHVSGVTRPYRADLRLAPSLLAYGTKVHAGSVGSMTQQNLSQALLAASAPPAALGLFVAASNAAGIVQTCSQAIQMVLLPKVTRENDHSRRKEDLERIFRRFWAASLVATLLLGAFLPVLILLVFGRAFRGAIVPAEVLLIAFLFSGPRDVLIVASQALGKPLLGSAIQWIGVAMMGGLLLLLMPRYGITGAAIAMAGASAVQLVVTLCELHRRSLISLSVILRPDFQYLPSLVSSFRLRRSVDIPVHNVG